MCVCTHMLLSQHNQIETVYFSQDCIVIISLLDRQLYSLVSYKPSKRSEKVQNRQKKIEME